MEDLSWKALAQVSGDDGTGVLCLGFGVKNHKHKEARTVCNVWMWCRSLRLRWKSQRECWPGLLQARLSGAAVLFISDQAWKNVARENRRAQVLKRPLAGGNRGPAMA